MKCPTCLESFTSKNHTVTTKCGHLFHEDCIQSWLETGKTTCPKCRRKISKKKLIRLFLSSCDEQSEIQESTRKKIKRKRKEGFEAKNDNERNYQVISFQGQPSVPWESRRGRRHRLNNGPGYV